VRGHDIESTVWFHHEASFCLLPNYPRDRWQLKALVAFVWLIELAQIICVMRGIYVITVVGRGRLDPTIPQMFRISSYFNCIIVTVVQVFYAYRLTKCFSKPYCACICLILTLFQCLGFLIFLAEWNFRSPKFSIISSAGFYAAGTADFLIAIFLSYYLIENRRNSSQTRTINILDKLLVKTIITGLIMGVIANAIATLILVSSSSWYAALVFIDDKASSNLMLFSLNSRSRLRETQGEVIRMNKMGGAACSQSVEPPR